MGRHYPSANGNAESKDHHHWQLLGSLLHVLVAPHNSLIWPNGAGAKRPRQHRALGQAEAQRRFVPSSALLSISIFCLGEKLTHDICRLSVIR